MIGTAASSILLLALGVGAFIYSASLDADANSFKSAHLCTSAGAADNCYLLRDVVITGVDVSQRKQGETDVVYFTDAGSAHELTIQNQSETAVLRTGAHGVATLWRGKYTTLDVGGWSFATTDNPVGQQGEWRLIGFIGIGYGLVSGMLAVGGIRMLRKRAAPQAPGLGGLLDTNELLPASTAGTAGYPGLPLVLRPIPLTRQVPAWFLFAGAAAIAIEIWSLGRFGPLAQWGIGGGLAVLLVGLFGWQVVSRKRVALFVDDMSFGRVDGLGRRKSWPRNEAARVVVRLVARGRRATPFALAAVVGPDGAARFTFPARLYDAESLGQFAAALRVPLDADMSGTVLAEIEREIPGAVSWPVRHATALGAGIAIVLIVAVVAVMVATGDFGPTHR
jgi:hypothetical protein